MTLVVARKAGDRIAVASDTLLTQQGLPLPGDESTIKTCILPGGLCVSFANSPELAERSFVDFVNTFPEGTTPARAVRFFEAASQSTGNDYLVAISEPARIVKIENGSRRTSLSNTSWIGDQRSFEKFREYETRFRQGMEAGRAVNAVMFFDELKGSPASDLYSAMRHVVSDKSIDTTGGFVCVVSNREGEFRHSVYCDMLFDWPMDESEEFILQLSNQIDFGASGENSEYAVAQVSTGYLSLNAVAYYILKGRILFLYHGSPVGLPNKRQVFKNVEPKDISRCLNDFFDSNLNWLLTVTSPSPRKMGTNWRQPLETGNTNGVGFEIFCHANTFPKTSN